MVLQEFAIPLAERHDISICTYFKSASEVPDAITLFEGDGTFRGFSRILSRALESEAYDIIHAHTPHVALVLLAKAWWKPRFLRKTVFTVHSCFENHKRRNRYMLLPVFALFGRLVCCSRSSFHSFPRRFRWLAGRRFCFVQNGVHTKRIAAVQERLQQRESEVISTREPESQKQVFRVASVGRLVPIKNLSATVAAVGMLDAKDCQLTIVGDGPLRESLAEQCRASGIENNVTFTGLLKREDVYRYLLESDLYLSTSFGEGLPVGVLEAMACGCPVVLSDIEPHREIAAGADFIPLIASQDSQGFAHEIQRFREMGSARRAEIGQACAQLVREKFSLESMHAGYEEIYDQIISLHNGRG